LTSSTIFLWTPAPGGSRHKRPGLTHIFICPCLMSHLWRKHSFNTADITFALPAGFRLAVWPDLMFEP
jgi:hypothetical protein